MFACKQGMFGEQVEPPNIAMEAVSLLLGS